VGSLCPSVLHKATISKLVPHILPWFLFLRSTDHIQITALTKALKVDVQVAYLDGHAPTVNFVDFVNTEEGGEDREKPAVLLYR
jgi:hypothetical protein